MIQTVSCIIVL